MGVIVRETDPMVRVSRWLRRSRLFALVLLIGCLGSGCIPTPYQRDGTGGGYAEFKVSQDAYRVTFTGNRSTPRSKIQNYLSYRCAELTIVQGHNSFAFTERLLVAADGSLVYAAWNNAQTLSQYRAIPAGGLVGGLAGALLKGAIKGALGGGGYQSQRPSGQGPSEPTGGVAQAVIQMFDRSDGELPQSTDLSDGVLYDARGVMRMLQRLDGDLSSLETWRIMLGEISPGTEVKRDTWQKQLDASRRSTDQLTQ